MSKHHDFDFKNSDDTPETQVGGFFKDLVGGYITFQLPRLFGKLLDWMQTASEEDIHRICGKIELEDAKVLRRFIQVVREEFTPPEEKRT